jgi:hypothetical protein
MVWSETDFPSFISLPSLTSPFDYNIKLYFFLSARNNTSEMKTPWEDGENHGRSDEEEWSMKYLLNLILGPLKCLLFHSQFQFSKSTYLPHVLRLLSYDTQSLPGTRTRLALFHNIQNPWFLLPFYSVGGKKKISPRFISGDNYAFAFGFEKLSET